MNTDQQLHESNVTSSSLEETGESYLSTTQPLPHTDVVDSMGNHSTRCTSTATSVISSPNCTLQESPGRVERGASSSVGEDYPGGQIVCTSSRSVTFFNYIF